MQSLLWDLTKAALSSKCNYLNSLSPHLYSVYLADMSPYQLCVKLHHNSGWLLFLNTDSAMSFSLSALSIRVNKATRSNPCGQLWHSAFCPRWSCWNIWLHQGPVPFLVLFSSIDWPVVYNCNSVMCRWYFRAISPLWQWAHTAWSVHCNHIQKGEMVDCSNYKKLCFV